MKFSVTMKSPDALSDGLNDAFPMPQSEPDEDGIVWGNRKTPELQEQQDEVQEQRDAAYDFAAKWIEYGEYVTIDFDTEADTATVRREK